MIQLNVGGGNESSHFQLIIGPVGVGDVSAAYPALQQWRNEETPLLEFK